MKKHLLLMAGAAMIASTAVAQEALPIPCAVANYTFSASSPDGKTIAGEDVFMGTVDVLDPATSTVMSFGDPTGAEAFTIGLGPNSISNDGVVVISSTYNGTASYIKGEEVFDLPLPEGTTMSLSNSVTPDGSRIAGTIGIEMSLDAQEVMQHPVIWNRNAEGTYDDPVILPYPTKDFTGRLPQYILVNSISEDGKTIGAFMVESSGMLIVPMVYTEDAEGTWTYKTLADDLINPSGIDFSKILPLPDKKDFMTEEEIAAYKQALKDADNLIQPEYFDFMTQQEIDDYNAALQAYSEDPENNPYPWPTSFMTDEEQEQYDQAVTEYYAKLYPNIDDFMTEEELAAYEEAYEKWAEESVDPDEVIWQLLTEGVVFDFNSVAMSLNGATYSITGSVTGVKTFTEIDFETGEPYEFEMEVPLYSSYVFDIATGEHYTLNVNDQQLQATYICNDGRVLVSTFDYPLYQSYIAGDDHVLVPIQDVVKETSPETYAWMEENMKHTIYQWNETTKEDEEVEMWITGAAFANADMTLVGTYLYNSPDYPVADPDEVYSISYFFPMKSSNGVQTVAADTKGLSAKMTRDGVIRINGRADEVNVYDINGRLVFHADHPASVVETGLNNGAYIVKVNNAKTNAAAKAMIF